VAIDLHELYGLAALPQASKHSADVPAIYRRLRLGGVFINPALTRTFGLTLLEAGRLRTNRWLATETVAPSLIGNCRNGLLVDPLDKGAIASALKPVLLTDQALLATLPPANGLRHVKNALFPGNPMPAAILQRIRPINRSPSRRAPRPYPLRPEQIDPPRAPVHRPRNTLLGDVKPCANSSKPCRRHRRQFVFGIATAAGLIRFLKLIRAYGMPSPMCSLRSLGTEITTQPSCSADIAASHHIDATVLDAQKVLPARSGGHFPGLKDPGQGKNRSRYKLSLLLRCLQRPHRW